MKEVKPYLHKVQYYETDKMGVTHHSNYIRFMEEARVDFFEQIDLPYDEIEATGAVSPVVSVEGEFKRTTTYPDVISVEVSIESVSTLKFGVRYRMTVDGKIVFIGHSTHCFIRDGRPVALDSVAAGVVDLLNAYMA